jgi:hypothetical protein
VRVCVCVCVCLCTAAPFAGQTLLSGMGELHLEVAVERLRREHGLEVRVGRVRVAYRETVGRPATYQVRADVLARLRSDCHSCRLPSSQAPSQHLRLMPLRLVRVHSAPSLHLFYTYSAFRESVNVLALHAPTVEGGGGGTWVEGLHLHLHLHLHLLLSRCWVGHSTRTTAPSAPSGTWPRSGSVWSRTKSPPATSSRFRPMCSLCTTCTQIPGSR